MNGSRRTFPYRGPSQGTYWQLAIQPPSCPNFVNIGELCFRRAVWGPRLLHNHLQVYKWLWSHRREALPHKNLKEARVNVGHYVSSYLTTFLMHSSSRAYRDLRYSGASASFSPFARRSPKQNIRFEPILQAARDHKSRQLVG